uniref:Uncharacterized protein n=1 Tax=Arundo donax TaxID=35708 RepID=A0A0A8ZNI0_ARUDO
MGQSKRKLETCAVVFTS